MEQSCTLRCRSRSTTRALSTWTSWFRNSTNVICTPLSSSSFPRQPGWTIGGRLQSQGHEIGNHSVTHEHAADLTKAGEELQVEDAKKFLDSNFNSDIITFAYPYTEVSPGLAVLGEAI